MDFQSNFDRLIGLRLSVVRFYGSMLGLHFGEMRPYTKGGTVGDFALHIDCPWRIDGPAGIVVGSYDRMEYGGVDAEPEEWDAETSSDNLRNRKLGELLGDAGVDGKEFQVKRDSLVTAATSSKYGDIAISLASGLVWKAFPAGVKGEAWRIFEPGGAAEHIVFPAES